MRRWIIALGLSASLPSFADTATSVALIDGFSETDFNQEEILFEGFYNLRPGPGQTGFHTVVGAPVSADRIAVMQSGAGCNLISRGVLYRNNLRDGVMEAQLSGRDAYYTIPDGQITEVNLYFEQVGRQATCGIRIVADVSSTDDDEWIDWETVATFDVRAEWGSESQRVGPFAINDLVKAVRLQIPRACGDVALESGALEVDGEWLELDQAQFTMSRDDEEKLYSYWLDSMGDLAQAAFRVRGKHRDCTAAVQVVYY